MSRIHDMETREDLRSPEELLVLWAKLKLETPQERYVFADSLLLREWARLPFMVAREICNYAKRGKGQPGKPKRQLRSEDDVLDIIDKALRGVDYSKGAKGKVARAKADVYFKAAAMASRLLAMKHGSYKPEDEGQPPSPRGKQAAAAAEIDASYQDMLEGLVPVEESELASQLEADGDGTTQDDETPA